MFGRRRRQNRRGIGGGLVPFLPTQLSGCVLWLRADMGITKDGSDRVSAWADQSGAGNDVSQGTAANQPLWVSPGRVDFVGARPDRLTGALGIDNQPVTLLLRARTTNVALNQYVTDGSGLNQRVVRFRGASDVGLYAGADLFGGAVANNTWAIVGGVFDGASSVLVVNSTRVSGNAGAAAANNLTLGVGGNGTSNPLTGSVSDVIAYSRALTSDEINRVVAYLTARP